MALNSAVFSWSYGCKGLHLIKFQQTKYRLLILNFGDFAANDKPHVFACIVSFFFIVNIFSIQKKVQLRSQIE